MTKSHTVGRRVAIITGVRTPFCKAHTEFKKCTSLDLGKSVVQELLLRADIQPAEIDMLVFGNVLPMLASPNVAREIVLGTNLPKGVHATTVMRACASSTEATTHAANAIALGHSDAAIVGGVECLSDIPILFSRNVSEALVLANKAKTFSDKLKAFLKIRPKDLLPIPPALAERSTGKTMGQSAEAMAKENGISREDQDAFALMSHKRAAAATEDGRLPEEIAPVYLYKENRSVTQDNHIRKDTTIEALSQIKPAFDKQHGTVTAGNSCPMTDGASAMLLMAEDKAKSLGYTPMGYIRDYAYAATDPHYQLLIGPAFAIPKVLERAQMRLRDMDLVDMHEAFAAQVLSNVNALASKTFAETRLGRSQPVGEIDMNTFNALGGSIAIGHPFAATGCRQMITMLNELKRRGQQFALVSQCAAGAMGAAILLER